jgi:methylenetetrahydrofolate--tRNA-(uracil-5-)-methyltransferase
MTDGPVHVVGGGLAGSEAAWQLARAGVPVILHEMRPVRSTEAHQTEQLAELVCSNSFRSDDAEGNAVGLLHEELRRCGSLIMRAADKHQVPAGSALAVDREGFAAEISGALEAEPLILIAREEVTGLPPAEWGPTIVATGPLTSPDLADAIRAASGADALAFFDAIAPIVHRDSVDMTKAWFQSRYDKPGPSGDEAAYINCPMDEAQYHAFLKAMLEAEHTEFREWERDTPYFEGCLPIEVMAARGSETLRYGPFKPVGLTNKHNPTVKAYAILQLRQDNALGTIFNLVGCQTKMRYGPQADVFRMVPGLETAEFARFGGIHRNSFLNSPVVLDKELRLKASSHLRFAGQVTGVEGYVESTAVGLLAAQFVLAELAGQEASLPPVDTALGALLAHVTGGAIGAEQRGVFQPMNVNFGLFPPVHAEPPKGRRKAGKKERRAALVFRARAAFSQWRQAATDLESVA